MIADPDEITLSTFESETNDHTSAPAMTDARIVSLSRRAKM